jgi:PhnB protein
MSGPTAPTPYLHFPGTAREALHFYRDVFGGSVELHTFEEFSRTDGPASAIAHGSLNEGPVRLYAADAADNEPPLRCEGLMFSLLGTATPPILKKWFDGLSEGGGRVVDDLQKRPAPSSSSLNAVTGDQPILGF